MLLIFFYNAWKQENLRFSDVFRGYRGHRKKTDGMTGFKSFALCWRRDIIDFQIFLLSTFFILLKHDKELFSPHEILFFFSKAQTFLIYEKSYWSREKEKIRNIIQTNFLKCKFPMDELIFT